MKKKIIYSIVAIMSVIFIFSGCNINYIGNSNLPLDSGNTTQTNEIIDENDTVILDYLGLENNTVDFNYAEIVASNKIDSIVNINCTLTTTYESYGSAGTGFIITNDGYLMTNAHVIMCTYKKYSTSTDRWGNTYYIYNGTDTKVFDNIIASFNNDSESYYTLSVVDYDVDLDLAILKFNNNFEYYTDDTKTTTASGFQRICEFTSSDNLNYGEPVVAIGNAQGYGLSVTAGIISIPKNDTYNAIQTNTAINPGNSGGPLFNINSQVIGITSSKLVDETVENMGYAIPSDEVISYINKVKEDHQEFVIDYVYEI